MSKSIVISRVYASEPDLLTREQKFSGGFVCNLHPDNADLMRRAARELNIPITEGEPRRSAGTTAYIGIYTDISKHDPQLLLQRFFTLLLGRSSKPRTGSKHHSKKEHSNVHFPKPQTGTKHPRRRKHTVKTARRPER